MEGVRRGDVVAVAVAGDDGKLRPALVVQDDAFAALDSITVILITSDLNDSPLIRIPLGPTTENGLRRLSQAMIDKIMTIPRGKLGQTIGKADAATMAAIDQALSRFLGLAA